MPDPRGGAVGFRGSRIALVVTVAIAAWLASGLRRIDPAAEITVLDGPLAGSPRRILSRWALAPPGLTRLSVYPAVPRDVPLPGASRAMLRRSDGSRAGFVGTVVVSPQPDGWLALHRAARAGRDGIPGVVAEAAIAAGRAIVPTLPQNAGTAAWSREIEPPLRAELASRGLELVRLELSAVDLLEAREGTDTGANLLVVGLDGADWAILDPLLERGKMPHLSRLIAGGARGKLSSITPTLSPVVWTSIATGVEPNRHGILDFLAPGRDGKPGEPVRSTQRAVPAFWEILSDAGISCGITGWWATWPAEAVLGRLVSDRLAYQLFGYRSDAASERGKTFPPELYAEIRPLVVDPATVPWSAVERFLDGPRRRPEAFDPEERGLLEDLRTLIASGETYLGIARDLATRRPTRLEAVYLEGTDTIGHLFMPYRPPRLPGVAARRFEAFHDVVDRYYEAVDADLGRLLEGKGPDWTVLVLSDHGFVSDATRPLLSDSRIGHGAAADWHRRFGIIVISGAHASLGAKLLEASVYDVAPTILALFGQPVPRSWPGRVLAEALDASYLDAHPVRFRRDDPVRRPGAGPGEDEDDPAAAERIEKLRGLGYIGSEDKTLMTTHNNRGVAFLAEGKFAEAEREFRAALADDPDEPVLWVNLGLALRHLGKIEEATERFQSAYRSPSTRRVAGLQLSQLRVEAGDRAGAERVLREVLASEPNAADALNALGLVLEGRGAVGEARAAYERAAAADNNAAEPRNNLGNLDRAAGRIAEAEAWYGRAIEADPFFMGAYNNLALIYQDRGEIRRAIDLYGRALDKSPENAVVLNNLGSLYYATGNTAEATRLWRRAAEIDPRYVSPRNNLAGIAIAEGKLDDAERLLREALGIDPRYGDARINLALVAAARGALEVAREELARAAEDPRARGTAWLHLGILELEQGRPVEARDALLKARRTIGDLPNVLNPLGEACVRLGRPDEAAEAWRLSLSVAPEQQLIREALERIGKSDNQ